MIFFLVIIDFSETITGLQSFCVECLQLSKKLVDLTFKSKATDHGSGLKETLALKSVGTSNQKSCPLGIPLLRLYGQQASITVPCYINYRKYSLYRNYIVYLLSVHARTFIKNLCRRFSITGRKLPTERDPPSG